MIRLITTDRLVCLQESIISDFCVESCTGLPLVKVDAGKRYQDILGFGIALTDASCHIVSQLPQDRRETFLCDVFGPAGLGLSVARLCVGASDYTCECYNYDNVPGDVELKHFSIDYDRKEILPVVKLVKGINPELFLFSSCWSAPGWMKTGGSMNGGWLRHKYLEAFAGYYTRYLLEYAREGIVIDALTCQNECETDQASKMPASFLHPDFEMELVNAYLPTMLRQNGLNTKLWILDHNFIQWNRAKWMLDDPDVKKAVTGVAFHYYEGNAEMLSLLHDAHPEVELHWTEGGPDLGERYAKDWCKWGQVFTEALSNGCRSITGWNLALDENGRPNLGPFACAGLVSVDSATKELSYSGQYRAFAQFSKFIRRGARRIDAQGVTNGTYNHTGANASRLYAAAFENPGGEVVVVLTNPLQKQEIQLQIGGKHLRVALPEDSITTVIIDEQVNH